MQGGREQTGYVGNAFGFVNLPLILETPQAIETGTDSVVTNVAFAPDQNYLFIATFGDGSVKAFDRRRENACVQQWHEHPAWIQGAQWRPRETKEFVTALVRIEQCIAVQALIPRSVDGQLKLYDLRSPKAKDNWRQCPFPTGLSTFDMHQRTGVFAV